MRRLSVFVLLVLSVAALAATAAPVVTAQEPEPPSGEPQPNGPGEPPDGPEEPGGVPGAGGGALPRTGIDAGWLALAGVVLLLLGARLRVLTRMREVIRRYRSAKVALREELEALMEAGADEDAVRVTRPPPVEPSTPVARSGAGRPVTSRGRLTRLVGARR